MRYSAILHIKFTDVDIVMNLRRDHERQSKDHSKPSTSKEARAYDGNNLHTTATMPRIEYTALKLPRNVSYLIHAIFNGEDSNIYLKTEKLQIFDAKAIERIDKMVNCRTFCKFIHFSSTKNATNFVKAASGEREEPQLNTVYQYKYLFEYNEFRLISLEIILIYIILAFLALKVKMKFLTSIEKVRGH